MPFSYSTIGLFLSDILHRLKLVPGMTKQMEKRELAERRTFRGGGWGRGGRGRGQGGERLGEYREQRPSGEGGKAVNTVECEECTE
jgi:hypothetical protein